MCDGKGRLHRVGEAVVFGMMERSCSSSLSIHTGWVMLGHLLAEVVSQNVFCGLSILNKEFPFLLELWRLLSFTLLSTH